MESWNTGNETANYKGAKWSTERNTPSLNSWQTEYFQQWQIFKVSNIAWASQYMNMVLSMPRFIRGIRSRQWNMRLTALHDFTKYFFSINLQNYGAMSALHICQMSSLRNEDPETWKRLETREWAPNKSGRSFCGLWADEALEQEKRKLNVMEGLVGITLQPQVLTKYFLNVPHISRLSGECYAFQGASGTNKAKHHQINQRTSTRQLKYCKTLTESFKKWQYHLNVMTNI